MNEHPDLRAYGRFLDDVQGSVDVDAVMRGAGSTHPDPRRRRLVLAIAAFVAVLAVPIVYVLVIDDPSDPAEQPAPPEENLGYDDLAPPTSRPVFLSADELRTGVVVHPADGGCNDGATGQIARVRPDGTVSWSLDTSWTRRSVMVEDGIVVGMTLGERPSVVAIEATQGTPLWQRYFDELSLTSLVTIDGVAVMSFQIRGEAPALVAYDVRNGVERWQQQVDAGAFLVTPDGALVVAERDRVRRIDPADGSTLWTVAFAADEEISVAAQFGGDGLVADPGDALLVRAWPATISRIDPSSGEELWTWTASDDRVSVSVHTVLEGVVVFEQGFSHSTGDERPLDNSTERVAALDLATGSLLWDRVTAEYRTFDGHHWISERWWNEETGMENPGRIIDAVTGVVVREFAAGERMEGRVSPGGAGLVVLRDVSGGLSDFEPPNVALVSPGNLEVFWELPPEFESVAFVERIGDVVFVGTPVSTNTSVITADPGGTLWAINALTGAEVWRLQLRDPFPRAPIPLPEGDLIVVASDPAIFCD